jgi:uncharacterized RmlC-like cupin family protein
MIPAVFDTNKINNVMSPQGQAMTPGFSQIEQAKISCGVVYMPPGGVANAHMHKDTDIIVYVIEAGPKGAVTLWGDNLENMIVQHAGEQLYMPAGIPHVAINPSNNDHIRACEYRSSGDLMADNILMPELQDIVLSTREKLLREATG